MLTPGTQVRNLDGNIGVVVSVIEMLAATYYICLFDGVEVILRSEDLEVV